MGVVREGTKPAGMRVPFDAQAVMLINEKKEGRM